MRRESLVVLGCDWRNDAYVIRTVKHGAYLPRLPRPVDSSFRDKKIGSAIRLGHIPDGQRYSYAGIPAPRTPTRIALAQVYQLFCLGLAYAACNNNASVQGFQS